MDITRSLQEEVAALHEELRMRDKREARMCALLADRQRALQEYMAIIQNLLLEWTHLQKELDSVPSQSGSGTACRGV